MSLAAWKMSFRATATRDLPRDLEHAIHWFPQARTVFADTLGFLLFWLELKFGPPRNTFLFEFKAACNEPNMRKRVFIAAQKVAISMSRNPPDDWLDDVGGPLKAHGYQMALQLIHAIEKDRNGKILLGRGREAFRLAKWSNQAEMALKSWEGMHLSVATIFEYGAPETLTFWKTTAAALSLGFVFCKVPGHANGSGYYAVDWLTRSLLIPFMRQTGVMALHVRPDDTMGKLPGPENSNYRKALNALTGCTQKYSVHVVFKKLGYTAGAELFNMWCCLIGAMLQRQKDQKRKQELPHPHFRYNGEQYMTLFQFKKWKKLTRNTSASVQRLDEYAFAHIDTIVFLKADSKHYTRQLPTGWRQGSMDLKDTNEVVLKSEMPQELQEKHFASMHAHSLPALENAYAPDCNNNNSKRRRIHW